MQLQHFALERRISGDRRDRNDQHHRPGKRLQLDRGEHSELRHRHADEWEWKRHCDPHCGGEQHRGRPAGNHHGGWHFVLDRPARLDSIRAARTRSPLVYLTDSGYLIESIEALDVWPPIATVIGYEPAARLDGTGMLSWYNPAKPGAKPQKLGVTAVVPMVTVADAEHIASGDDGAGSPLAG